MREVRGGRQQVGEVELRVDHNEKVLLKPVESVLLREYQWIVLKENIFFTVFGRKYSN